MSTEGRAEGTQQGAHAGAGATPIKIVVVHSFVRVGGSQQACLRLARQLRRRGQDARVWFLYRREALEFGDVPVEVMSDKPKLNALEYAAVFVRLCARMRRERPDVVLGFLPLGAVMGTVAAVLTGVRSRMVSQRAPGPTFGRILGQVDKVLGSTGAYRRIVCVSDAVRRSFDRYPQAYRRRLTVVHNGLEWEPSALDRAQARARFGLPSTATILLAVGRLEVQKNFGFLVDRVADAPGVMLLVAGEGEQSAMLERKIAEANLQDRVRLLGNVRPPDMKDLMVAADVFVQPSLYEGQSNALLEAMHSGMAIVASDIPMSRETLVDDSGEEAGLILPLGDPEAWSRTLERLRDAPAERNDLGLRARRGVERRFTIERMIEGFEREILADLSERGGASVRRTEAQAVTAERSAA